MEGPEPVQGEPLPEDAWAVLGFEGGTGNVHFDDLWCRRYAAQRDCIPIEEIVASQIGGCDFDGSTVPERFLRAASQFDWEPVAERWAMGTRRFLRGLRGS